MIPRESDDRELSRQECLALLTTEPYGRLVLVRGGLPTVYPVNFVLDGAGLARLPLQPWVAGERNVFVVEVGIVSGQRIGGAERVHRIPGPSPLPAVPAPA